MNSPLPPLQRKDPSQPDVEAGLYQKFEVYRTDRRDEIGFKHHGCEYFVLDITHDQFAKAALAAYAEACRATHPQLAEDILTRYVAAVPQRPTPPPGREVREDRHVPRPAGAKGAPT